MADRETSVVIRFNEDIDLSKINPDSIKDKTKSLHFIKDENKKIKSIFIIPKKSNDVFIVTNKTITGKNDLMKKSSLVKNARKLAENILEQCGLNKNNYNVEGVHVEFSMSYSLRDNVFSDEFKKKIEKLLLNNGYDTPDYAGIKLILSKDEKSDGIIQLEYNNKKDYEKNKISVEVPKKLKNKLREVLE